MAKSSRLVDGADRIRLMRVLVCFVVFKRRDCIFLEFQCGFFPFFGALQRDSPKRFVPSALKKKSIEGVADHLEKLLVECDPHGTNHAGLHRVFEAAK